MEGKTLLSALTICAPGVVVSETLANPKSVPAEMLAVPACRQLSSVAAEVRDADGSRKTKWPCVPMTGESWLNVNRESDSYSSENGIGVARTKQQI